MRQLCAAGDLDLAPSLAGLSFFLEVYLADSYLVQWHLKCIGDCFEKVCVRSCHGMNTILASLCSSLAVQWDTLLVLVSNVTSQRARRPP